MIKRVWWLIFLCSVWLVLTRPASAADPRAFHEELGEVWGSLGREIEGLFDRWQEHFGSLAGRQEGPSISMIIRNREKLDLTAERMGFKTSNIRD